MRRKEIALGVCAALAQCGVALAQSVYFGFDQGFPEPVNNQAVPPAQRVNSTAANALFRDALVGESVVSFEQSEGYALASMNPVVSFPGGLSALTTGGVVRDSFGPGGGINSAAPEGRYPVSGEQFLNANSATLDIDFSQPVVAFGFWGVDIGDFNGTLSVQLLNGATTTIPVNIPGGVNRNASVMFWGVIWETSPFVSVRLTNSGFGGGGSVNDIFAFDDFIAATEVPTPSSAFALLGVVGSGVYRKRSRPAWM